MKLITIILDYTYGVNCRHCGCRVIDPDKTKQQKFLTDRCPECRKMGTDPVEKEEKNASE